MTDNGSFYPQALYSDLLFEITLAEAAHVVRGSDATKLKYKLTNIQLQYEMIRSETLADEAESVFNSGKEFAYDHVMRSKVVPINKGTETTINIKVDAQRKSLKAILLLFIEGYTGGGRDSRSDEGHRHDQRHAQQDLQQRYGRQGHVGRGQPLLCEREEQN